MSYPHTGKLEALVNNLPCHFDGDVWTTPDAQLTAQLNTVTKVLPKTDCTILEMAELALHQAGLSAASHIVTVAFDPCRPMLAAGART